MRYDVVVVGLGAMGSAAVYQLAKRGASVLGLDQWATPHSRGSSHGDTRITRQAIGEGDAYTPLVLRSHEIWAELEHVSGRTLLTQNGGLILGTLASGSSLHGKQGFLEQTLRSAEKYHIPHTVLTAPQLRQRFPQFKVRDGEIGYYEPGAGFLRPECCIEVQLTLAQKHGAVLQTGERLLSFAPQGTDVLVKTDQGSYQAKHLLLSMGPWLAPLLPLSITQIFSVYRQVQYWFDASNTNLYAPEDCPVFIWDFGTGDGLYGFPAIDGPKGGIKVAGENFQDATTPDAVDRTVSVEETAETYAQRVAPCLRDVSSHCLRAIVCLYTVTPDFGFVIDALPGLPQVTIASPCSGHGFKHSAALGEALAQHLLEGQRQIPLDAFRLKRFGV